MAPRRAWSRAIALGCCQIALLALGCGGDSGAPAPPAAPARIVVTSAWRDGATIPVRFTCSGAGARPPVAWRGVPRRARELVLVVTDPDAPGGRFVHWTAYGIAPDARVVPRRVREGRNSAGKDGWTPPCPPKGDDAHHYTFAMYEIKNGSSLADGASPDQVRALLKGAVARGSFTATYKR